jgi:hypothetical protein
LRRSTCQPGGNTCGDGASRSGSGELGSGRPGPGTQELDGYGFNVLTADYCSVRLRGGKENNGDEAVGREQQERRPGTGQKALGPSSGPAEPAVDVTAVKREDWSHDLSDKETLDQTSFEEVEGVGRRGGAGTYVGGEGREESPDYGGRAWRPVAGSEGRISREGSDQNDSRPSCNPSSTPYMPCPVIPGGFETWEQKYRR